MHRLMTISLTLSLALAPLTAVAVVYHYANFNPRSNPVGQAVLLKSTPATPHTVSVNNPGGMSWLLCVLVGYELFFAVYKNGSAHRRDSNSALCELSGSHVYL
jgi:hypothetical protein